MMRSPISTSGMCASTVSQPGQPSRGSKPSIWPRWPETIWVTREVCSLGTCTFTCTTGSSRTGEASFMHSLMARRAAILKAISEESTV